MRYIAEYLGMMLIIAGCGGITEQTFIEICEGIESVQTLREGRPLHYQVVYSADIDPVTVNNASASWNELAGAELFTEDDEGDARAEISIGELGDHAGYADYDAEHDICIITMAPERADSVAIMVHEMGHCLGFKHSDNPLSVMAEETDREQSCFPQSIRQQLQDKLEAGGQWLRSSS